MQSYIDGVGVRETEYNSCARQKRYFKRCDAGMYFLYLGGKRGQDTDSIFSFEWDQESVS